MASHIKIKTERDNHTHATDGANGLTLCKLEIDGDKAIGIGVGKYVKSKINCPDCIEIIIFCKNIKESEYKTS